MRLIVEGFLIAATILIALAGSTFPVYSYAIPKQTALFIVTSKNATDRWNYPGTNLKPMIKVGVTFTELDNGKKVPYENFLFNDKIALSCKKFITFPVKADQPFDILLQSTAITSVAEQHAMANVLARLVLESSLIKSQLFTVWIDTNSRSGIVEELDRLGFVSDMPSDSSGIVPAIHLAIKDRDSLDSIEVLYFNSNRIRNSTLKI